MHPSVSIILGAMHPETEEAGGEGEVLRHLAVDLISAVHAKDAEAVCESLEAFFSVLESMPHEEYEGEG